ncbi:MAG: AAA family ATPase [bacterium]|nr:AAA family ATPase [bacterium]
MEVKIFNFGPIKKCEFDLSKDLTVIYGKNNIGKSYAMSAVYLLLKHFLSIDNMQIGEIIRQEVLDKKNSAIGKEVLEGKECNVSKKVNNIIKNIFDKALSGKLGRSFGNTFGQLGNMTNGEIKAKPRIQLTVSAGIIQFGVGKSLQVKKFSLDRETVARPSNVKTGFFLSNTKYTLEFNTEFKKDGFDFLELLVNFISDRVNNFIESIRGKIEDLYFLPASRSGLYTGLESFYPLLAELSKTRALLKEKIELPAMTEPIADYTLRLSGIHMQPTGHKRLSNIVSYLEKNILKGEINFDPVKKRLTYSPENSQLVLDMTFVSSMVSELAPIVAYIKYILGEKSGGLTENFHLAAQPFIFIEEAEAHLHPEAQVQLVEVFKMLIEAGVKVIITSHSNYIFNKISNMLIAKTLDLNKYAPIILKETDKGSVSQLMEADELGVEDENFYDTAVALYEEREQILETLNQEIDDYSQSTY